MIGEKLKLIRKNKKLTQSDLAEILNISTSYVSELEGNKKTPGGEILYLLKSKLDIDLNWLLTKDDTLNFEQSIKMFKQEGLAFTYDLFKEAGQIIIPIRDLNKINIETDFIQQEEDIIDFISFNRLWMKSKLELYNAIDNLFFVIAPDSSMEPTICKDDLLLIATRDNLPNASGVYLLNIENPPILRRIQFVPDGNIEISCDNKLFNSFYIDHLEKKKINTIGKVLWVLRTIDQIKPHLSNHP